MNYGLQDPFKIKPKEPLFIEPMQISEQPMQTSADLPMIPQTANSTPAISSNPNKGAGFLGKAANVVKSVGNILIPQQEELKKAFDEATPGAYESPKYATRVSSMGLITRDGDRYTTLDPTGAAGTMKNVATKAVKQVAVKTAKPVFQGLKGLSTKLVEDLKGKFQVSKSYLQQRMMSSDLNLKQVEKDLVNRILERTPDETLNVTKFAENVQDQLLPLKIKRLSEHGNYKESKTMAKWKNISLQGEERGNVGSYEEHIYESPVETQAGNVHFARNTKNYFGHTRVEDIYEPDLSFQPEIDRLSALPDASTLEGSRRISELNNSKNAPRVRRVIELQSDLYQRGRLDNEVENAVINTTWEGKITDKKFLEDLKRDPSGYSYTEIAENEKKDTVEDLLMDLEDVEGDKVMESVIKERIKFVKEQGKLYFPALDRSVKKAQSNAEKGIERLKQYSDPSAHFRMVREEVKRAAEDGRTKLQFPTGKTAMKIEGLDEQVNGWEILPQNESMRSLSVQTGPRSWSAPANLERVTPENIKVGQIVSRENFVPDEQEYVVTKVLDNGRFKVIPRDAFISREEALEILQDRYDDVGEAMPTGDKLEGRIDDIIQDMNDDVEETFSLLDDVEPDDPIYKFYEKTLGKYLKTKYNAQRIKDAQGIEWFEVNVDPEAAKKPVEAFGIIGGLTAADQMLRKNKDEQQR